MGGDHGRSAGLGIIRSSRRPGGLAKGGSGRVWGMAGCKARKLALSAERLSEKDAPSRLGLDPDIQYGVLSDLGSMYEVIVEMLPLRQG